MSAVPIPSKAQIEAIIAIASQKLFRNSLSVGEMYEMLISSSIAAPIVMLRRPAFRSVAWSVNDANRATRCIFFVSAFPTPYNSMITTIS